MHADLVLFGYVKFLLSFAKLDWLPVHSLFFQGLVVSYNLIMLQIPGHVQYNGSSLYQSFQNRSFDDFEIPNNKQTGNNRAHGLAENNLMKSLSVDKDKASSVAKIKVVVCNFSLPAANFSRCILLYVPLFIWLPFVWSQ